MASSAPPSANNTVLIIGGTRGLGAALIHEYASSSSPAPTTVLGTTRSPTPPAPSSGPPATHWLTSIDVGDRAAGATLVEGLRALRVTGLATVIVAAGYFGKESFAAPDWDAQVKMYTTSAIGPVFLVHALHQARLLTPHRTKIILVSSESGSIGLRHASEGGGNFAHHASKAALNMVGKLLSLDLQDEGVAVGLVHPGFMRTEMTRSVGFDQFWDEGGAVTPEESARSLREWVEGEFGMEKTGTYWAPRGPGDIGTAEHVLGPKDQLPTPLQLPW